MTPLILGLGVPELLIILAVVLLLFGGARLAGLGKSTGRAMREFKEETKGLTGGEDPAATATDDDPAGSAALPAAAGGHHGQRPGSGRPRQSSASAVLIAELWP